MSKGWPKIIYDPLHKIIPFEDTPEDRLLLNLINTKEFQRLRRIKQLGMSDFVFPGATHTRFTHSIGVLHIARRFLSRLERLSGKPFDEKIRIIVLVAALLHDIGHGPFSHAFEKITGEKHEKRTWEIIIDKSTEINKVLMDYDKTVPELIGTFFNENCETFSENPVPSYLGQIISSQLDADRSDYLLRDSLSTGANYGNFDLEWLINHLYFNPSKNRLYLSSKALVAAEAYIFARYHMYRCVYFHKTTRAVEVMLKMLFKRYKQLIQENGKENVRTIIPNAPESVINAFSTKLNLSQYLSLDDFTIFEFIKACENCNDDILKTLGTGIIHRRLFKVIDASNKDVTFIMKFSELARDMIRKKGLNPDYTFIDDTPADIPYKPYNPDEEEPATQIYIEDLNGKEVEIGNIANAINELKKKYTLIRYYCLPGIRDELKRLAGE